MVPTIQKSDHSKSTFLPNGFLFAKNHLKSRFKCQDVMLWLRLKTWSFENRTIWIQSLKTPDFKYFQISNALFSVPHYIWNPTEAQIARLFELFSRIFLIVSGEKLPCDNPSSRDKNSWTRGSGGGKYTECWKHLNIWFHVHTCRIRISPVLVRTKLWLITRPRLTVRKIFDFRPLFGVEYQYFRRIHRLTSLKP